MNTETAFHSCIFVITSAMTSCSER